MMDADDFAVRLVENANADELAATATAIGELISEKAPNDVGVLAPMMVAARILGLAVESGLLAEDGVYRVLCRLAHCVSFSTIAGARGVDGNNDAAMRNELARQVDRGVVPPHRDRP